MTTSMQQPRANRHNSIIRRQHLLQSMQHMPPRQGHMLHPYRHCPSSHPLELTGFDVVTDGTANKLRSAPFNAPMGVPDLLMQVS